MRGGQWQVVRLVEGLIASGIECRLQARAGSPLLAEALRRGWTAEPLSPWRVFKAVRQCDLVHCHDARTHTLAAVCGGAPLIVARRVAFPIGGGWKYGRAARYIAVSRFVAGILTEGGVARERIAVVHDGVPLLNGAEKRDGVIAPDNITDAMKGAAIVANASELSSIDVRYSDDLEHDLLTAAVFVYVSHSEGLGSAVLLAMSAGAAVIASDVGGLPEIVNHRETGLLVENIPQAVGSAMRQLVLKPEWAQQLAAAARRRIEQEFTVETMVSKTLDVYRQVLA